MRHILQSLFGLDLSTAQKVIVASVVILILLVLLGLFVRQIQGGRLKMKGQSGGRARQPRLGVVDAHNLDRQRQLILIRRDNVEHLIMIGGASDVVVETNIVRSGSRTAAQPMEYPAVERPQAFDSLVPQEPPRQDAARQDTARQEPARQEPARQELSRQDLSRQDLPRQEPVRQEPVRQEPVEVAQPRPDLLPPLPVRPTQATAPSRPVQSRAQANATMAVAVPAALAAAASSTSSVSDAPPSPTPTVQPPSFARDHAPSPTASAVELDSMARQLEEALKRPFSAVRPANSPGEPPATPKPARGSEVAPAQDNAAEARQDVVEPTPARTVPEPAENAERVVALPADVEAELEMALGLKPERTAPLPPGVAFGRVVQAPEPTPADEPEPLSDEPMDEEPSLTDDDDLIADADDGSRPGQQTKPVAELETDTPRPGSALVVAEPEAAAKAPEPEQKPAAIDPFSVDAIEAEFARLLGRDPKAKS